MKRLLYILLCALCAVSFAACGRGDGKISVTFDGNGGATESGKTSVTLQIDPKGDFVAPIFGREDYRFIGWGDKNGNKVEFKEITKDSTVYAQWLQVLFTVTLDGNGGETEDGQKSVEVKVDPLKTPEIPEFTYEGYDFVGWDINFAEVTQNCTATAIWAENGAVRTKIAFDAVGGTEYTGEDVYFYVGTEIPANVFYTPERGVDRFEGWYLQDEKIEAGMIWQQQGAAEVTLTAKWNKGILVEFDTDGKGTRCESVVFYDGEKIPALPVPESIPADEYNFRGWYYNDEKLREGEVWHAPEGVDRIVLKADWSRLWTDNY